MDHREKLLDWLNKEQEKDREEVKRYKEKIAQEMLRMKKEQIFEKPKNSIWKRIQKLLWGN